MKNFKTLILLGILIISTTLAGCWNNKINNETWNPTTENSDVINYNDNLMDYALSCVSSENDIWSAYDKSSTIEDIENIINSTITRCNDSSEKINNLWDRNWDSSLKDAVLAIVKSEINYLWKFNELLPYIEKENLTEEEKSNYDSIIAEIETINNELNEANNKITITQEQFAEKYWFELENIE